MEENKSNKMLAVAGAILVILVAVGAFAYTKISKKPMEKEVSQNMVKEDEGKQDEWLEKSERESMKESTESVEKNTTDTTQATKTFSIEGSNYSFAPAQIKVKKGDKVVVKFMNVEGFHDFVIDELNVKTKQITGPAEETVEFVADKAGSFEYYCSVGKHREMGMVGTLVVEE